VAALGEAESGKTTLVGVLTKGALDNGCVQSPTPFLFMGFT
jgi:GTPase